MAHEWEILYEDTGGIVSYSTAGGELTFDRRPYVRWASRTKPAWPSQWSAWTQWHPGEHFPGDIDGDGVVGIQDFKILLEHFGETVP
jgi:hypothetical protein